MAKLDLTTVSSGYYSQEQLNANFQAIEAAVENLLSRDGTLPNSMSADMDMNGNSILNIQDLNTQTLSISGIETDTVTFEGSFYVGTTEPTTAVAGDLWYNSGVTPGKVGYYNGTEWLYYTDLAERAETAESNASTSETNAASSASAAALSESNAATSASNAASSASAAATSESNAATSETNAATSATAAQTAETNAEATYANFENKWQGVYSTPPTLRPDGTALQEGDAYTDATSGSINLYINGAWDAVTDYVRRTSNTGSALIPSGTEAERDTTPAAGHLRFNKDTNLFEGYNGSLWASVGAGATGGGGDQVFVENEQTVTTNYTIPATKNAMTTGPITVNDGVTVTVETGARWVVI